MPQQNQPLGRPGQSWRLAVSFLTRIPIGPDGGSDLPAAFWAFPLVGAAIGLSGGVVCVLAVLAGLPLMGAVILALMAMAWLTGALHEDGLADTADGFGGGGDRDAKLAIMRDSRIGTYGVLTLILVIGLKITLVTHIGARTGNLAGVIAALAAAAAISRAAMLILPAFLRPARADGLGRSVADAEPARLVAPVAVAVAVSGAALWRYGWSPFWGSIILGGMTTFGVTVLAARQIGGYTGDTLGAAQQISETAILAVLAATMEGVSA